MQIKRIIQKDHPCMAKKLVLMRKVIMLASLCLVIFSDCSDKVEAEINNNNVLAVYPNPMMEAGRIYVNSNNQPFTLTVFDPTGEIVLTNSQNSSPQIFAIDVSDRPTGKYHVVCKVGNLVYSKTLLKI
jgi:Secretion system C-terminal sorting domain